MSQSEYSTRLQRQCALNQLLSFPPPAEGQIRRLVCPWNTEMLLRSSHLEGCSRLEHVQLSVLHFCDTNRHHPRKNGIHRSCPDASYIRDIRSVEMTSLSPIDLLHHTNHRYTNISGRVAWNISRTTKANMEVGYLNQDGQNIDLDLYTAKAEVTTLLRQLTIKLGVNMYRRIYLNSDFTFNGTYLQITRKF